jgi:protein TonB
MTENSKIENNRYESFDDIVFNKRNKEYGAFIIRKKYKKSAIIAFVISFFVITGVVAYPMIQAYYNRLKMAKKMEKNVLMEMEKLNEDAPPPPPPPPPAAIEAQVKFKAPVVVDTMKEEVMIATADELTDIGNEAPPEEMVVEEKKNEVIEAEEPVFVIVEEPASFQGGDINSFRLWVQSNMVYPTAAAEAGIAGKVIVQFAINSKGQIVDARVLRSIHPELDKEAIRCLVSSPPWVPGKQGGKAVKQQFVIPIVFQLQ